MKNYLIKIFSVIAVIFISFFINKLNVRADGFNETIVCEYSQPIDYSIGTVEKPFSNEIIVRYEGDNDDYTLIVASSYDDLARNYEFKEGSFYKYIIGKKNGSKEKRGSEYRTCPSYVSLELVSWGAYDYVLSPITFATFEKYINNIINMYSLGSVGVKNNKFKEYKYTEKGELELTSIQKYDEKSSIADSTIHYLYLKKQIIDGKETNKKPINAIKKYFQVHYGFSGDGNTALGENVNGPLIKIASNDISLFIRSSGKWIKLKKDFINISNYSFKDYDSFKKYALSSFTTVTREDADTNITKEEWINRQRVFYYIDSYTNLISFLENDSIYKQIFNSSYQDTNYNAIRYLIKVSSEKNIEKKNQELNDRTASDDAADKNICVEICSNSTGVMYSGAALTQCQSDSLYKKCSTCVNRCNNVPGSEHEKCMNTCYGTTEYKALTEKKQKNKEELKKIQDKLYSVSAPKIDIQIVKHYVPDCDDFQVFHTIYNILRVIAPILVIIFGTLDYAKAVIASDIEKMEKSKKNFPKRLLLLVLFIMVPFIISFLISNFSSTNITIARCVVNGS